MSRVNEREIIEQVKMGQPKEVARILDSCHYDPVDMRDIVGNLKQVCFSKDTSEVRWNRIGKQLDHQEWR